MQSPAPPRRRLALRATMEGPLADPPLRPCSGGRFWSNPATAAREDSGPAADVEAGAGEQTRTPPALLLPAPLSSAASLNLILLCPLLSPPAFPRLPSIPNRPGRGGSSVLPSERGRSALSKSVPACFARGSKARAAACHIKKCHLPARASGMPLRRRSPRQVSAHAPERPVRRQRPCSSRSAHQGRRCGGGSAAAARAPGGRSPRQLSAYAPETPVMRQRPRSPRRTHQGCRCGGGVRDSCRRTRRPLRRRRRRPRQQRARPGPAPGPRR